MIEHSKGLEIIVSKRVSEGMNYMETLKTLHGADPREVWEAYKKQKKNLDNSCKKIGMINLYPELPEPHPAYSQWRMTPGSADRIIEKIEVKNYKEVCFLGCPVLGMKYSKEAIFLDIDNSVLENVKSRKRRYDVNEEVPDDLLGKFDCVVADPPWYLEDVMLFAVRSAELTKKGGTIYISLPKLLTRPFMPEERLNFQRWLTDNSLIISEISATEYEVPPFEYMAYSDIPAFTGEIWRVGDFFKLKKAEEFKMSLGRKENMAGWEEFRFGKKRVFLRQREIPGEPKVSRLGSLILNSVSKRNPLIPSIDIWSSRNAVLHIDSGYNDIKNMLATLEKEYSTFGKFDEEKIKDNLSKRLAELILV